jgi:hypothetical protein
VATGSKQGKRSEKAARGGWTKPSILIPFVSLIVTGLVGLSDPVVSLVTDDDPVYDCGQQIEKYGELRKRYPESDLRVPEGSAVEKQCRINGFLDSLDE